MPGLSGPLTKYLGLFWLDTYQLTNPLEINSCCRKHTALKAGGTLIELEPHRFVEFVSRYKDRGIVVVHGMKGVFTKKHVYVTALHGLVFYCSSPELLPVKVDIEAKTILIRV